MAPKHLAAADREHSLAQLSGLPARTAATALVAQQPERAVELLEASRGILTAGSLDARSSDVSRLRETDPDLADRFEALRVRLDDLEGRLARSADHGGPARRPEWTATADLIADRRQANHDFDALLDEIRSSFPEFMRPPTAASLCALVAPGPVIYLTADPDRCDAIILGDQIRHVPLEARGEDAEQRTRQFRIALGTALQPDASLTDRQAAEAEARDVLAWIWDAIAEPVLAALGFTGPPADGASWPRIWWCPVGGLAILPIHAAGYHQPTKGNGLAHRTVLDRVVSSYTTTIRALAYAKRQGTVPCDCNPRTLIVAETGGVDNIPRLPHAASEVSLLATKLTGADLLEHPGPDQVVDALPGHAIAHFACHGVARWDDPGSSSLILREHGTAPLTVRKISGLRLSDTRLAYLSACETSISSEQLADETVHIASAFQLAGYQHVVGSLWPVGDRVAVKVTENFYSQLTGGWVSAPDTDRTALALHEAIRSVRDANSDFPIRWSPFVHFGP
jgi:hypothetical protein